MPAESYLYVQDPVSVFPLRFTAVYHYGLGEPEAEGPIDGLEAVEAAAKLLPEVVLLDIGMPNMNGYDAARQIRAQPWGKNMVLIALTGGGQEQDRERTRAAGFDAHLLKPVDHEALVRLLASTPGRTWQVRA